MIERRATTRCPPRSSQRAAAARARLLAALVGGIVACAGGAALAQSDAIREEVKRAPKPKLTKPPKLLRFVEAKYPAAARAKGVQGAVELLITLDARGAVTAVKVLSAPAPALGLAAAAAARRFRFSPAEVDGKPAPIQLRYRYRFVIREVFRPRLPYWLTSDAPQQTYDVIVGVVREQGTRLPLAGVAVAIPDAGVEVKTDGRGRFAFADLTAGRHRLVAISPQHKRTTVFAEVREGQQTRVKLYIEPKVKNPYETVVRGKRRKNTVTRVTLRGRQLTSVPGTFGDPVRVVENLPGLARIPYVGGGLLIRGAAPTDSGAYLDGVRIPVLYHFLGGPSVLHPQFLDRIDYYPGNADARYNRLTAGVIDVSTRDTFTRQLKGAVDVNLLNTGVFLNVPITSRVSVAGAVRRSYIDAILPVVFDAAGQDATTVAPVYYDYQARVDVRLAGDDRLWVLAFGSDDDLKIASNEEDQDFAIDLASRTSFHRVMAQWRQSFGGGRGLSKLAPYFGFNILSIETGDTDLLINSWVFGVREDLEYKLTRRVRLRVGADLLADYFVANVDIPLPVPYRNPGSAGFAGSLTDEPQRVEVARWRGSIGLYVGSVIKLTEKLEVLPGVRFDLFFYQTDNVRPTVDPRLTLRYALLKKTTLKGGVGLYTQSPSPIFTNDVAGNPNLVLEHAWHFSLGVEQQLFLPQLKLDAQVYYLHRYAQAVRSNEVLIEGDTIRPLLYTNQGRGYSVGLEVLLKHEVSRHFYGWLAYTLSWSKSQRVADGDLVRFAFDQRHILTLVGSFRFDGGWEAGFRFRLVSGRPETPIEGGVFDADGGFFSALYADEPVDRQMFHQLDLRVEKTWLFKLWRLSVYLDIQNVYNAENPEATLYDYRFRESGPLRGLPFLPSLGVKGAF